MNKISNLLNAHVIALQTLSWITYNNQKISDLRNLFNSLTLGPRVSWKK
jgi:hypothetical protein